MINVNTSAVNYHVPTPNVTPQPSQLAHPGNQGSSEAVKSSHGETNSAADNQASASAKLLNLSAPLVGERPGLQRMYGLSLNSGLLQLGDVNPGKVVTARCYTRPVEDTKPPADAPKNSGTSTADVSTKGSTTSTADATKKDGTTSTADVSTKGGTTSTADVSKKGGTTLARDVPTTGGRPLPRDLWTKGTTTSPADGPKNDAGVTEPKVSTKKRTDDTIYGFNSNTGKPETTLKSASDKPDFNVWDERGNDTFDFSGFKQNQIISLRGGSFSSVGGMKENVRIDEKTVIENAVGGRGNDRIIGNSANNVLTGGAGADTLEGGGGWNTFKFNAFSDSTRTHADLLVDFNTGKDKIDLSQMARDGKVALNFVENYTGAAGDTIIKFNPQTGRYLLAIDLDGDGKTDFLIKSTRMISPEDVIGLNIKDGGYL
ncbi:M10 family metallopeptidase C-terminal domain-containing protein [Pseudomonas fluorescens]|uniref:M10 family metallopeptidase C-terminal domain-containing protein n=1 Tax=Pseudomonas fluorescens TaxID=294 RepID=UPI00094B7259|nr:M10 family metallopeptidase C-terminal domain-containing protein [Pseudomonas fluorescens]